MPERSFIAYKRSQRKSEQLRWLCRTGAHRMPRTMFVVQHDKHMGLCGNCFAARCARKPNGKLDIATYWLRDWPESVQTATRRKR
jgi:hypothetical protein